MTTDLDRAREAQEREDGPRCGLEWSCSIEDEDGPLTVEGWCGKHAGHKGSCGSDPDAGMIDVAHLRAALARVDELEVELFEARAIQWALDEAGAYTGVKPPEVEGWRHEGGNLVRLWGAADDECGPVLVRIVAWANPLEYEWTMEEGDGAGGFDEVVPERCWLGDHPWEGPATGEADTLRQAIADAEAAAASRLAWQVEEGRRVRAREAPDAV